MELTRCASRYCASTGWLIGLGASHGILYGRLLLATKGELPKVSKETVVATAAPSASSNMSWNRDEVQVDGMWNFSSFCGNSEYFVIHSVCERYPAQDNGVFCLLKKNEIDIVGNWDASAMQGTGSSSIRISRTNIRAGHFCEMEKVLGFLEPQSFDYVPYVFTAPYRAYITTITIASVIGALEGAFGEFRRFATSVSPHSQRSVLQCHKAALTERLEARVRLLTGAYNTIVSKLHKRGKTGDALSETELLKLRADRAEIADQCLGISEQMAREAGTRGFLTNSQFGSKNRDLQMVASHTDLRWDKVYAEI